MADQVNLDDWRLLAQFSQIFRTVSDAFAEQVDVPRGQAMVLCVVAKQEGMTQSEIADALSVQGATVTSTLQRLEEAGLVVRHRDPDDNRLVRVSLTEEGVQKEHSLNAQFASLQELILKGISEDDRAALRQQIQQIIANIT